MANDNCTQPFSIPPKQPLYLSMNEVQAFLEIDQSGITNASPDAKDKLQALATCLATELLNFSHAYPHTPFAGLVLNVEVLLPVFMAKDWVRGQE